MKISNNKKWLLRALPALLGAAGGAVCGYLYYLYVGCSTGSCAITSNPYNSVMYFAAFGALIGFILTPSKSKKGEQDE